MIETPPMEDKDVVNINIFYKNYEVVSCQADCEYTYDTALTPEITSVTFTGNSYEVVGSGFTSSSCLVLIEDVEQQPCTINSATNITGTVDNLKKQAGIYKFVVKTDSGNALFALENSFQFTFTAISLSTGSTTGNIVSLTVEGAAFDDLVVLKSGSTIVSSKIISSDWTEIVLETASFSSDQSWSSLTL